MTSSPPSTRMSARPGTRLMSMRTAGFTSLRFIIGTRLSRRQESCRPTRGARAPRAPQGANPAGCTRTVLVSHASPLGSEFILGKRSRSVGGAAPEGVLVRVPGWSAGRRPTLESSSRADVFKKNCGGHRRIGRTRCRFVCRSAAALPAWPADRGWDVVAARRSAAPTNLSPEYMAAKAAFKKARDPSERPERRLEMLRTLMDVAPLRPEWCEFPL